MRSAAVAENGAHRGKIMTDIHMPRLSDTMEEGVIAAWRKQVGDQVRRGDVVADIETDKAIMEREAYDDGVLEKILVAEGETVPIGTPIAVLGDGSGVSSEPEPAPSEQSAEDTAEQSAPRTNGVPAPTEAPVAQPQQDAGAPPKPKASPLAKAVARELGVNLADVQGTGPGGRIIRADVEAAAEQQQAAQPAAPQPAQPAPAAAQPARDTEDVEEVPLSRIRKVTAKRLTESKQQAPHRYLTSAIDVTELVEFRATLNERLLAAGGPKVSINDLVVKAVATALRANPSLNVSFAEDKLLQHKRIHLGVAVALEDGLVVPVIRD